MRLVVTLVMLLCLTAIPLLSQDEKEEAIEDSSTMPPPGLRDWTPLAKQFELYINFDGDAGDKLPRIDILSEKKSWPFYLEKFGDDTVYLYIAPPGYELKKRSTLTGLEDEFPLVVWAGKQRATFWFSHDSGKVVLDTLTPAPFLTVASVQPLPPGVQWLQLPGTGKNAKVIRSLLTELGDQATLIQLGDSYYENIWYWVHMTTLQRWKVNETQVGTFLVFQCADASRTAVAEILQKYKRGDYANH